MNPVLANSKQVGMVMNLKLSSIPQFCGVRACNSTNAVLLRNTSSTFLSLRIRRDSNLVPRAFRPSRYEQSNRINKINGAHDNPIAQPSAVDMFLQGNASSYDKGGQVSRSKYEDDKKGTERISGTQFLKGGDNRNAMGLGEDCLEESSSYEKGGTGAHDKQSSEGDFLDLARQSSVGDTDMIAHESIVDNGGFIDGGSGSVLPDKSIIVNSDKELDFRKQAVKRSSVIAKQVISKKSALSMGFVSQLWVDTSSWTVQMVEIRPSLFSGEMDRFFLKDLCQVGDVILVDDENVLENELTMIGLDTLVGYNIVTEDRYSLGKIRDYKFNINLGNVAYLEFDSFGVPFIPPSVVSTYCLLVEDVIQTTSDTIVVRSGSDVRVQRLTKGLWEAPNLHAQVWNEAKVRKSNLNSQDYEGQYSMDDELERQLNIPSKKYYSNKGRGKKSVFKESDIKDEWGLPLDY